MKLKKTHQAFAQANNESNLNIALAILFYFVQLDLTLGTNSTSWEGLGCLVSEPNMALSNLQESASEV